MWNKKTEIRFRNEDEARSVKIVGDALIGTQGTGGGRFIPLVILDTSDRPDIEELIRVHQVTGMSGDVKLLWGQIDGHVETVALFLTFIRPSEATILLEFDIAKQGILVDQALSGKGLYIMAGREGDRLTNDPYRPKVLLEVPDTGIREIWDAVFHKSLEKIFRSKGLAKPDARKASKLAIAEMRNLASFRMRDKGANEA